MRSLIKAINGQKPFLIDYQIAQQHLATTEKLGFTDLITKWLGESPKPYQVGGTYVIPINGVIGKGLSPIEAIGATDVEVVDDWIDQAVAANPQRIVFNINSDGGTVDGVEELANKIRNLKVPTIAFGTSMNSSAYWIGSAADRVVVTPSASVGSIGVFAVVKDLSEQAKAMGITVKVFRSDELKGIGVPGTQITSAQEAYLQKSVIDTANVFKADVKMKRKMVADADLTGASMSGREAAQKGLATGLVDSFKVLMAQLEPGFKANTKSAVKTTGKMALKAQASEDTATEATTENDGLTPRQRYLVDELEGVVETFGEFNQTSKADGAHYVAASPFVKQGLVCSNCVFFQGGRKCGLVSGDIDPNAICKLWVIPEALVKE
jgi:ClpP class serine protease